jgi:aminoglycoside phosphotransferase (APT) family kinase protein
MRARGYEADKRGWSSFDRRRWAPDRYGPTPMASSDDLAERLGTALNGDVSGLTQLSGGASRLTYAASLNGEPIICQLARGPQPPGRPGMGTEGAVIRAARAAGVPAAEVLACSDDGGVVGTPFLAMRRVDGETIARKIQRDDEYATARNLLPAQLGRAAAAIHSVPVESVPGLAEQDNLAYYRDILDQMGQPTPAFEYGFRWLFANRPPVSAARVVHGDFRLGNVIVGGDGLRAVLDWELSHLGDPMEDLGWVCVRAWRFGGRPPVAGLGEYHQLFDSYSQVAGVAVDPDVVRWWEVLGTLSWGVMCMIQASAHLSGVSRSHELAAIGRRVTENAYDLLRLLP